MMPIESVEDIAERIAQEPNEEIRNVAILRGVFFVPPDMTIGAYMDAIYAAYDRHGLPYPMGLPDGPGAVTTPPAVDDPIDAIADALFWRGILLPAEPPVDGGV